MGIVLGIDYSLNCPSMCLLDGQSREWFVNYRKDGKSYPTLPNATVNWTHSRTENELDRISELAGWVLLVIEMKYPQVVVIEDYAFGAKGSSLTHLAENAGYLKVMLRRMHPELPVVLLPPTKMKKLATGKGNARKELIWASFIAKFPEYASWAKLCHPKAEGVGSPCADIADSYFLAEYQYNEIQKTKVT